MPTTPELLVTGAAGGIGSAIVGAALVAGYRVCAVDRREPDASARPAVDGDVRWVVADLATEAGVEAAFAACTAPPRAVVNNAGAVHFKRLEDLDRTEFLDLFAANVLSTFLVARHAVRAMGSGGGAIINLSSICARAPAPGTGAYSATKGAIEALTRQLAIEVADRGIRVNAVAPGFIDSGMGAAYPDQAARERRVRAVPLGRLGTAADVAAVVLFLCSDAAAYVTGETLLVDGGLGSSTLAQLPRSGTARS